MKMGRGRLVVNLFIICCLVTVQLFSFNQQVKANAQFDVEAESAILIEVTTGKVLFEKNADLALPPASMSKMMTEYLILEAIRDGKFDWDTMVPVSAYAHYVQGSTVFLTEGQEHSVRDLMIALAAFSANDATVALAEFVAGSEASFVELMNQKAKELGMNNTYFVNSSGLPNSMLGPYLHTGTEEEQNLMSARDTAILARALVTDFPEVLEFASALEVPEPFSQYQLFNFNWMLPGHPLGQAKPHAYPGLDGLKTGHTQLAGYCFTATAERDGMRLISVVMRSDSENTRFQETRKLLDYGFNNFVLKEIISEGDKVENLETLPVYRGKEKEVPVAVGQSLTTVIHKDEEDLYSLEYVPNPELVNEAGSLMAPLAKGDVVGSVRLHYSGDLPYELLIAGEDPEVVPLVAEEDVEKAGWLRLFFRGVFEFFAEIWLSIVENIKGWFS